MSFKSVLHGLVLALHLFKAGVGNLWFMSQIRSASSAHKAVLEHVMPTMLNVVCGCLCVSMAQLSCCERDLIVVNLFDP